MTKSSVTCFWDISYYLLYCVIIIFNIQLVYQSAMDPAGIFMLNSIHHIFEILDIPFNAMNFVAEQFDQTTIINEINVNKKCPVITAANFSVSPPLVHAMVATGVKSDSINGRLEYSIQCKNSYRDDPSQQGTFYLIKNMRLLSIESNRSECYSLSLASTI